MVEQRQKLFNLAVLLSFCENSQLGKVTINRIDSSAVKHGLNRGIAS